jgi:putative Ca2+/H+ antiporter (TMEM165/GDT1 family)
MLAFLQSLGLIAAAEMGDKSQLVALAFATRFRAWVVLLGVLTATLAVHLVSVFLGRSIDAALSQEWVTGVAGLAFIAFGLWTLRGDSLEDDPSRRALHWGAFATVTATFLVAELGDKTMLATVTLAAGSASFVGVWLGSTLGMVLTDAVAIVVGMVLGRRLPARAIKLAAATVFIVTGVVTLGTLVA